MDEQLQKNEPSATSKFSTLIRQFLAAAGEVYGRDMTPLLVATYESALADLPESELRETLNATLGKSKFWPTPAHIHEIWESCHAAKDQADAEQAWELVITEVYLGGQDTKAFDGPTEFALRSIGGFNALRDDIPDSEHRFVRKTFIEAYCRFRATSGYLAPSRAEAIALQCNQERRLEANHVSNAATEAAQEHRQKQRGFVI